MERLPLAVFGGLKENPLPARVDNVRRTWSVPPAKFTSSHLRPRSSPCLIPVVTASTYKASSLSPSAASSSARACSGERGFISLSSSVNERREAAMNQTLRESYEAYREAYSQDL